MEHEFHEPDVECAACITKGYNSGLEARDEEANDDPYSYAMSLIRQALESSLDPNNSGKMNEDEYQLLLKIRGVINILDPSINIEDYRRQS